MSSSGSYNFSMSRDNIITTALQLAGIIGEGETGTSSQVSEAAIILNMIVKLREADGMPVWALKRGFVLPFSGTNTINTDSHVVTAYDTTTLTAASTASDTTLTVDSITGFSASDQIGIELDDGSIDWTTINGAPSGSVITITTGVTSAAAIGNRVYGYTASSDRIQKPLRILHANTLDVANTIRVEVESDLSFSDFYELSSPAVKGSPMMLFYDPSPSSDTALETNGRINIWPRFADGTEIIEFTYQRPFMDFDSATDEPDFPQAFYLPLTLELTTFLGIKGGVTIEERREMRKEALYYLEEALKTVVPEGSIFLQVDSNG